MTDDSLKAGRDAIARHAWKEAFDLLSAADASRSLAAEDLERLGNAAFWIGRARDCIRFGERSAAAYTQAGDRRGAARVSLALAGNHFWQRSFSVGVDCSPRRSDCSRTSPKLRSSASSPCGRRTSSSRVGISTARWRPPAAPLRSVAASQTPISTRGLSLEGSILIRQGKVADGMALIDESMAAAVGGELGPLRPRPSTARRSRRAIASATIGAPLSGRKRWRGAPCESGMAGFPGDCRAHRVGLLRMHGTWTEAEHEAEQASLVEGGDSSHVGMALYEVGEIRLRRGDFAAAEEAFRRAEVTPSFTPAQTPSERALRR